MTATRYQSSLQGEKSLLSKIYGEALEDAESAYDKWAELKGLGKHKEFLRGASQAYTAFGSLLHDPPKAEEKAPLGRPSETTMLPLSADLRRMLSKVENNLSPVTDKEGAYQLAHPNDSVVDARISSFNPETSTVVCELAVTVPPQRFYPWYNYCWDRIVIDLEEEIDSKTEKFLRVAVACNAANSYAMLWSIRLREVFYRVSRWLRRQKDVEGDRFTVDLTPVAYVLLHMERIAGPPVKLVKMTFAYKKDDVAEKLEASTESGKTTTTTADVNALFEAFKAGEDTSEGTWVLANISHNTVLLPNFTRHSFSHQ
jgi:hypothetical protein